MNNKETNIKEVDDDDDKSLVEIHVYDLKNRINIAALKKYGIHIGNNDDKGKFNICYKRQLM
jgi:hypothetical protein